MKCSRHSYSVNLATNSAEMKSVQPRLYAEGSILWLKVYSEQEFALFPAHSPNLKRLRM